MISQEKTLQELEALYPLSPIGYARYIQEAILWQTATELYIATNPTFGYGNPRGVYNVWVEGDFLGTLYLGPNIHKNMWRYNHREMRYVGDLYKVEQGLTEFYNDLMNQIARARPIVLNVANETAKVLANIINPHDQWVFMGEAENARVLALQVFGSVFYGRWS